MSPFMKGIAFAMVSYFFMALYSVFLKQASHTGDSVVWINFISYFTGALILSPYMLSRGTSSLKTSHLPIHLGRAFCGVLSSFLYTWSMGFIPLVSATLFFNTSPLFIPLLSIFLLGAKVGYRDWIAVFIGFVGVVIIMHPWAAAPTSDSSTTLHHDDGAMGEFIALGSGFFLALGFIFIKMLTKSDSKTLITYYFCVFASLMQLPFVFFAPHVPAWSSIAYAAGSGAMMVGVQFFLATAYSYADASKIGALQYSSLLFVGLISWILWNEVPTLMNLVGMALVVVGGVMIVMQSSSKPTPAVNPSPT
jgi:drug/metabolite transporter (DMT)-like permease